MLRDLAIIRASAVRAADAATHVIDALQSGQVEQEPAFTERMLGAIEEAMREFEVKGVKWRAKSLTDRAPGAQEKEYGADFAGVLSVDLPNYKVNKGFLAQAKLIEPDGYVSPAEVRRMKEQCRKMLDLSPASFVFLYCRSGISVVPALAVVSADLRNPHELYSRGVARFYEEHFESFIGDQRISSPNIDTLDELRTRFQARDLLYLSLRA